MAKNKQNPIARPPIVVVMGHVDHGKTSLLDFIRKTKVVEKEAGGITQHIGAYEIEHGGKKITFIDTPGHEAFSKMRSRGAKVADIAILVVAADEGVKPQTEDALKHIKEADIPFTVAINKIDKPGSDPEKIKKELATREVLVEGWGGKIPVAATSAKTGEGVKELLDLILLVAELEELKGNAARPASGVVIESHLDPRRGPTATIIIRDGVLHRGDLILAGNAKGKVKILEDFNGKSAESLSLGSPARTLGWETLPEIGSEFVTGEEAHKEIQVAPGKEKQTVGALGLGLILKADVAGSLEALQDSVQKLALSSGAATKVLDASVGEITESDVKLADATGAMIISFRAKLSRGAESFTRMKPQKIMQSDIIYELLENLEKEFKTIVETKKAAEILGKLEVLATFDEKGEKQIIGGRVVEGKLTKGAMAKIIRRGSAITTGKISNLQLNRQDVSEVTEGNECGILFDAPIKIVKGDILEISG